MRPGIRLDRGPILRSDATQPGRPVPGPLDTARPDSSSRLLGPHPTRPSSRPPDPIIVILLMASLVLGVITFRATVLAAAVWLSRLRSRSESSAADRVKHRW